MARPDIVLLHPPSVMDFRERAILAAPVSDLMPSTPVFEMYPIGFTTIAAHLESKGYEARIVNIANKMLISERFDPSRVVKGLDAAMFGIDLHWMPPVQGALEFAKLVKAHHPGVPVVMGGFSASYYHRELLSRYPQVDFVLRRLDGAAHSRSRTSAVVTDSRHGRCRCKKQTRRRHALRRRAFRAVQGRP